MTATYQSIGVIRRGSTSLTAVGMPASIADGDVALMMVVTKPDTATITTPAGWTSVANVAGGGGTTGLDTGPTRQAWFYRVKDASWSTVNVTITSGNSSAAVIARVSGAGGSFDVTAATGAFGTVAPVTDGATTLGSDPGITSGDLLLGGYSSMIDTATWSAEGVTTPGVTIGAATEISDAVNTTDGNDIGGMLFTASATAGTSTGAPSTQATASVATRGTVALVRVRESTGSPTTITGGQATETDAAQAGVGLVETRRNYEPKPSAEVSEDWAVISGSNDPARSTDHALLGSWSVKFVRGAGTNISIGRRSNFTTLMPGAGTYRYTTNIWVDPVITGDAGIRLFGTGVGTTQSVYTTTRSAWAEVSITFTWDGVGSAFLDVVDPSITTGATAYLDASIFTKGSDLVPYFDGDTAPSGIFSYRWAGTPYASQSVQMAPYVAPTTVSGGQAAETSTAFAGVVLAAALIVGGQAAEVDTAQAGTTVASAVIVGGQATETDTALAGVITEGRILAGGQATETDTARAGSLVASAFVTGGRAQETDTALAGSVAAVGAYVDEVLADSPVAYYRLGESSGTTLVDSSGHGHNGTYVNTPTLGAPGLVRDGDTAVDFDGSTEYANVAYGAWADVSTGLSVEAWIRPDVLPGGELTIVDRSDPNVSVRLSVGPDGQVRFWFYRTGIGETLKATLTGGGAPAVSPGQTRHVVGTYDGSHVSIYVNGSLAISSSVSGALSTVGTPPLRIGATAAGTAFFDGRIDEVAYYDHALTAARVAAHYAAVPPNVAIPGTRAIETDSALAGMVLGGHVFATGGQAQETDEALPGAVLAPATTDTSNRVGGRHRSGYAVATWDPPIVDPPPTIVLGEARDRANAFGPVTMDGTQAVYDVTTATKKRLRDRIVVGGKDITYWRDKATPLPAYQLVSPLLYGPATLRLPQVAAAFEQVGVGALSWLQPGKPVKVQRVDPDTGEILAVDYLGLVIAFNASGRDLSVEIGGEASGRAALMEKQLPIFRSTHDIGQIAAFAMMPLKVPFLPHRGPTTGIRLARFGGTGWLDYISQLCARAWTRSGTQWTIMPGADGAYRMTRKDTTTVDATAYLDDARTVADLRRDKAEEPNRIFVTGITPDGQRVMFAAFPGLQKTRPAPYPFTNNRTFGSGTTDAETDTGDGITVMVKRLNMFGIVAVDDAPGGYDVDITKAIRDLQEDAELPVTGDMNPATWRALYDLDATGYSLRNSEVQPAAQKSYTKPWLRSPSGAIMRRNPNYDPAKMWVDRVIDMGSGFTKDQMREYAVALLEKSEDNWVGTITFHTGGLVAGSHGHSFTPTGDDVFRARRLKPGMNIRLPHSPGGDITVHVSAVSVDEDGKVTTTVDTQARDSMNVWEVIERNRESRRDPARQWIRDHRASGQIKDAIDGWWAPGGKLGANITVPAHTWTMVEVVAGQEGTVQALRVRTNPNAEYVMAVFGRHVHPKRLARLIGNPLTKKGAKKWADEGVRNNLDRDRFLLYAAGDDEQPLGYYPKTKRPDTVVVDNPDYDPSADEDTTGTDDEPEIEQETGSITPLTGRWEDAAGFSYRTFLQPVLYVYVYADRDTSIPAGRIMWPQLEAGA